MDEIGIEQARNQLGEIVDRARFTGEATLLTRTGKPAAVIVNADWYEQAKALIAATEGELAMNTRTTLLATAVAIAALGLAGCAAAISKTPAAPASTTHPPATTAAPSPSASAPLSGPAGTSYTVTSSDGSSYTVTLDQVEQHATAAPYETPTNQADHFAAAEFTITGVTGNTSDDANSDANAIGSDGVQYPSAAAQLTVPNFSYGEFNVSPGQSVKGWVAFELPPGVTVGSVQWAPGFNSQAATWTVGS